MAALAAGSGASLYRSADGAFRGDGLMESTKAPFWCFTKGWLDQFPLILMHSLG